MATQHGLRNGEQLILNHIDNNASNTTTVEASNTINHITPPKPKNKSVDGHSVQLNSGDGWLTLRVGFIVFIYHPLTKVGRSR